MEVGGEEVGCAEDRVLMMKVRGLEDCDVDFCHVDFEGLKDSFLPLFLSV